MTSDASTLVMAGGLIVAIALLLPAALSWHRARRDRRQRLREQVEASRVQASDLTRRREAGELTLEEYDMQQGVVAEQLLASLPLDQASLDAPGRRWRAPALATAGLLVALAAIGFRLWPQHPERPGEALGPAIAQPAPAAQPLHGAHALSDEQLEHMVAQSRRRVQDAPQDAAAWAMLAHSYDMLGKFSESSKAYAMLARLAPKDAQVLADYADALAVANGRTFAGEPTVLVNKALEIDPRNVKALTLAGSSAFERQDYNEAIARWRSARDLSKDPRFASEIDASLATARAAATGSSMPAAAVASAPPVAAASAVVSGRITLAEDLQSKVRPDATVFVFARPIDGSRMPVAILRRHVSDLPLQFALDDSMAMVPEVRLSKVSQVVVGARISRRGDVAPQAGDMQGLSAPVSVGTRDIKLEISEVLQ